MEEKTIVFKSKIAQNFLLASQKEEFLVDAIGDVLLGFPLFSKSIGQRKISRFQD